MHWSPIFAFALLQAVLATPLSRRWDDFNVKHAWVEIPRGWIEHSDAPADHKLDLRIGLKQDKFDELVDHLYQVSDPMHARYGAHLSKEEVEALVAPHPESVNLVESWLGHHGVDCNSISRSQAGDWLSLTVTVEQAERMLGTKYKVYYNSDMDSYVVRTLEYNLPSALSDHVSVVAPTTYFGSMRSMKRTSFIQTGVSPLSDAEANAQLESLHTSATVPASCTLRITPACLQALYNTTGYVTGATDVNKLGITGYLEQFANTADLQSFYTKFLPAAAGSTFELVEINGGENDQSEPGVEANLDTQYGGAISFATPNVFYSTGGSPPFIPDDNTPTNTNEPYLDWLDFIINQTSIPQTFTTSYGDDEQTVPLDFATSVCNLFAQLGARGSSVMFSSGDDGVGGGDCLTNNGSSVVAFQPNFPASCPFVTTVGGTVRVPEVAVDFSAGGFSNYFDTPSYQSAVVNAFVVGLDGEFAGLFNASGRAYPDVAAQAENFQVILGGEQTSVAGTSCSSPTFSGVVALLNDFRISNGKAPLGFLNPLLYSSGTAGLNDITSGSNPGCGTNGFTAGTGWDPVTGLGTPDFGKLQAIVADI